MSFAGEILALAERRPDTPALRFLQRGEREVYAATRGTLFAAALKIAGQLEAHGLAGQRVLLAFDAGPEFVETVLACSLAEAIAVPVPMPQHRARSTRLDLIVEDCDAAAVLCRASAEKALAESGGARNDGRAPRIITYETLASPDDPRPTPACRGLSAKPDDVVLIQYTSGSTRHPQGAMVTNRNLVENSRLVRCAWRLDDEIMLNWMPHFHDMGLMGGILYPLLWGEMSVQMAPLSFVQRPARWLRAISSYRATMSGGPAFAFDLVLKSVGDAELADLDLSCWRRAFCGAEPVPERLLARFRDRLRPAGLAPRSVFACYGMAETTLFVAGAPEAEEDMPRPRSETAKLSGIAPCPTAFLTGDRVRIIDPGTRGPVNEDNRIGEIWISSPSVVSGYFGKPGTRETPFGAVTEPDDGHRYLRTGDLGFFDGDRLHVAGRLKDTLIVNGRNVAATDVEWLAGEMHPELNPLAAAAFEGEDAGSAVLLIEVRDKLSGIDDIAGLQRRIALSLRSEFALDPVDVHILRRGVLERTTSGKIRRQAARGLYLDGAFGTRPSGDEATTGRRGNQEKCSDPS